MSDFAKDFIARQEGAAASSRAAALDGGNDSWIAGFAGSALSSIPELFGQNPTPAANAFRSENPLAGFASEVIPTLGAYGAAFKASKAIPMWEAFTEAAPSKVAKFLGTTAESSPILSGAVKEIARYTPFELSRLGIGLATAPSDNYGNLFADVGLSTLLNGGFGGIGGFFKRGGKVLEEEGRIAGTDNMWKPTFAYRMSLDPAAEATSGAAKTDVQNRLINEVLTETPQSIKGSKPRYVDMLEGGTPESDAMVNSFFKAQPSEAMQKAGFDRRTLLEGAEGNRRTLDAGEQAEVLAGAGFKDLSDLAATAVYPRVVTIQSERAAGTYGKMLDDAAGLNAVGDGTMIGREARDGLWIVGRRLRSPVADNALEVTNLGGIDGNIGGKIPTHFGTQKIAAGDRWLWFKTDQPQRFAPEAAKIAELNVSRFAKYQEMFKPAASADVFNRGADDILAALTPQDYRDLASTSIPKATKVAQFTQKLAKKFGEVSGLEGSAQAKQMADWLVSVAYPRQFKETLNPLFGRGSMLLRNAMHIADNYTSRVMGGTARFASSPLKSLAGGVKYESGFEGFEPVREIWSRIAKRGNGELQLVFDAARTQTPADDLAKLSAGGLVSAETAADVKLLQDVNQRFLEKVVLPGLEGTSEAGKFDPLKGYVLPRIFRGDHHVSVTDEKGVEQWLASGVNGAAAQREAKAVVDEAALKGYRWKMGETVAGAEMEKDGLERINAMVNSQIGKNAEAKDVIQSALGKLRAARASGQKIPRPGEPSTFTSRTGRAGSADVEAADLNQIIKDTEQHYRQLARYTAYHTWNNRFAPLFLNLSKQDKTLGQDLQRMASQYMGIEGPITRVLNNALAPVLGPKMATKIAQGTNNLMYLWNIGIANPTFAILNVLQPLQTVAPMLSFALNATPERMAQYMQFVPKYGADGLPRGTLGFLHPMKLMAQAVRMSHSPVGAEKEAMERALTEGVLNAQVHEDWIGEGSKAARTLADSYRQGGAWEFIKHSSTYLAEKSETFSRMIAYNSFHLLGRDHFGLEGDQLFRFAKRGTEMSMYSFSVVDRSRMFTGPVGSMFGLFKNWQFHFIGQMGQYAKLGLKDNVWGPLLWQGGAALAVGGLGATPLRAAADGLARWQSDSPDSYTWLKKHWQGSADEVYFGLPALLGVSLQASATLPGTDVRNDVSNMSNFVFLERAKAAGKAMGAAWDLANGADQNPLRNPNVRDQLLAAFAPRAVFRGFSAAEGEYVKSMATGLPSVRDVSAGARIFQTLGFNTVEIEAQQKIANKLYMDQEETRSQVQSLGQAYAQAEMGQDWNEMERLVQRAVGLNVPISSVMASARTRLHREQQGDSLSRYSPAQMAPYLEALGR